jgi:hypothetical protein
MAIVPGQGGTCRHLPGRVTHLLADSGQCATSRSRLGRRRPRLSRPGSTPSASGGTTRWSKGQDYDRAATWHELVDGRWRAPRPSGLDLFKPYLSPHADGSRGSILRLFREIKALGDDGAYPRRPRLPRPAPPRQGTAAARPATRSACSRPCWAQVYSLSLPSWRGLRVRVGARVTTCGTGGEPGKVGVPCDAVSFA